MEIMQEVAVIKKMGFDHVLLVTGEANQSVHTDYFKKVLDLIKPHFAHISMEVQPLDHEDYKDLRPYGLNTVLVYQETYHKRIIRNITLKVKNQTSNTGLKPRTGLVKQEFIKWD